MAANDPFEAINRRLSRLAAAATRHVAACRQEGRAMNAKHTPGPWHPVNRTVHETHGDLIATCAGRNEPATATHCANARLIAAAPDLLAALVALVALIQDDDECLLTREAYGAELNRAEAAIAKAETGR